MIRARLLPPLAIALGCSPTELVLVVQSDLHQPQEIEEVEIVAAGSAASAPVRVDLTQAEVGFPLTLGLRPAGEPGEVTVEVVGRLQRDIVVSQRVRTGFVRGESRLLAMELLASCRGVACAPGETCGIAGCTGEEIPGPALPPFAGRLPPEPRARALPAPPDAGPPLVLDVEDDFDDGVLNVARWKIGVGLVDTRLSNSMKVAERDGTLVIEPHPDRAEPSFKGYVSVGTYDMRGAIATVEVPEVGVNGAQTVFALDTPAASYLFRISWHPALKRNFLVFEEARGTPSLEAESHRPGLHRFWRFRHDLEQGTFSWETSATALGPWTTRRSIAITPRQLEEVTVVLYGGTIGPARPTPGLVRFDNFFLGRPRR